MLLYLRHPFKAYFGKKLGFIHSPSPLPSSTCSVYIVQQAGRQSSAYFRNIFTNFNKIFKKSKKPGTVTRQLTKSIDFRQMSVTPISALYSPQAEGLTGSSTVLTGPSACRVDETVLCSPSPPMWSGRG